MMQFPSSTSAARPLLRHRQNKTSKYASIHPPPPRRHRSPPQRPRRNRRHGAPGRGSTSATASAAREISICVTFSRVVGARRPSPRRQRRRRAASVRAAVASTSKCSEWLERVSRPGASLLPSSPLNPFRQPAGRRDATDATDLTPAVSQSESPPARNDGMLGTVAGSTSCFSPRSAGPLPLTCLSALRISDPSSGRGDQVPGPRAGGLGPGWT
ncbi:hypothetical protein IWZ03DRAFT_6746 [Phyllosticta citriasiana]|uniref:Uncharacterized protein n=1 Tax=Phyllosticta citriasiana TaxID=595635 RepID=A0ABR1KXH9_9PEZI